MIATLQELLAGYDLVRTALLVVGILLLLLVIFAARIGYRWGKRRGVEEATASLDLERNLPPPTLPHNIRVKVVRVIDGDTFEARPHGRPKDRFKVRVLGLDTPESRRNAKAKKDAGREGTSVTQQIVLGKAATTFARGMLEGKWVRLEARAKDQPIKHDQYARFLAYVRLSNGKDYGEEIIRRGYAECFGWKYSHPRKAQYARVKPSKLRVAWARWRASKSHE